MAAASRWLEELSGSSRWAEEITTFSFGFVAPDGWSPDFGFSFRAHSLSLCILLPIVPTGLPKVMTARRDIVRRGEVVACSESAARSAREAQLDSPGPTRVLRNTRKEMPTRMTYFLIHKQRVPRRHVLWCAHNRKQTDVVIEVWSGGGNHWSSFCVTCLVLCCLFCFLLF